MTDSKAATLLLIFARAFKEAADALDDKRTEKDKLETKPEQPPKEEKPKTTTTTRQRKPAAPKVKKEDVIKKFQELSKSKGGRAKIDDILEDHLPEGTPLKASNLKPAQYASVLEATQAIVDEEAANPDTPDDDGFE